MTQLEACLLYTSQRRLRLLVRPFKCNGIARELRRSSKRLPISDIVQKQYQPVGRNRIICDFFFKPGNCLLHRVRSYRFIFYRFKACLLYTSIV